LLSAPTPRAWDFDHPMSLDSGEVFLYPHHAPGPEPPLRRLALARGADRRRSPIALGLSRRLVRAPFNPTTPTARRPSSRLSTERDLVNRTGATLHVSRFIGRLAPRRRDDPRRD
jgi:hypothetical protein